MIKLSIIIPMFNVAQYLRKCVLSAFNQGLSTDEFEIIMVDDESPDNSLDIAKDMSKTHDNITVISQKNKGLGGARNTGITHAKGEYLLFLDADDYLLPNTFKFLVDMALNKRLDVLEFGSQGVLPNGNTTYKVAMHSDGKIYEGIDYYNRFKYMNSACNKLYNRKLLLEHNNLFLEQIYIEDFEFNTRVFYHAQNVMAVDTIGAHYLQSPDSITRNTSDKKKAKMLNDLITVLRITKSFSEKAEQNSKNNQYFGYRMCFINVTIFYQLIKNKKTYAEIKKVKRLLKNENLFHVNYALPEGKKDLFRRTFLKHFWLFRITNPLFRVALK